jgi:putative tryptophan/tyrosine transport system substrate-binding protein
MEYSPLPDILPKSTLEQVVGMRRRDFIALAGSALTWPLTALAQQSTLPVVGVLVSAPASSLLQRRLSLFRQGLKETGYPEGQVAIEFRWADGQYDRLPALAADLVHGKADVIVTLGGTVTALAAKTASNTIPIVFMIGADPVELGLVASLGRPGRNMTGTTSLSMFGGKPAEILFEMVPEAAMRFGFLVNPANPLAASLVKGAVDQAGERIVVVEARAESEFEAAFAILVQQGARGLVIWEEPFLSSRGDRLAELAARYAMPAIHGVRDFAMASGLMSYTVVWEEMYHQVGVYAGRILKGDKPGDLPVLQPTKVELVINLKSAKALGLTVPPSLFARADELIE